MQIPIYDKKTGPQSQDAAQARVSAPLQDAFGGAEAQAHARMGGHIERLGLLAGQLARRRAEIKETRFNAFVDAQRQAYRENRPYSQTPQEDKEKFYQTLEETGRQMLGPEQWEGWKQRNQVLAQNYELDDALYQTQKLRADTLRETQEALDEYTHLEVFGASARARKAAAVQAQSLLDGAGAYATPQQLDALKEHRRRQAGTAAFVYDSNANAAVAARKLKNNAYHFTPIEKARAMDSLAASLRRQGVKTDPQTYVDLEERARRGEDIRADVNLKYVSGALTLADRDKLLKTQEDLIPAVTRQAVDLIKAKFSAGDLDANFGFVKYTQQRALQSFYALLGQNKNAAQADIMGMAERVIDEYQKMDNDTIAITLPVPAFASAQGLNRKDMQAWSEEQLDRVIDTIMQRVDAGQMDAGEGGYQVMQFRQWRPYIKNQQKKNAVRTNK